MSSNSSLTIPTQCSAVKKGGYCIIKGHPCKVVDTSTSKTGKHGHAKVHMVGIDIFTNKKYEKIESSTHNVEVPVIKRSDYQLLNISDDDYLELLTNEGDVKADVKLPEKEELKKEIQDLWDNANGDIIVSVLAAMDHEQVVAVKVSNN
eukprot:TRINITY_DN136503_c0_g1_i1.p1 TRINITY_DN136503_c0_g1~~TRINITY_DN136503_c0_g1_i1.p1  ORF type:complete len:149 (-),score=40.38 TRINITY_DN136503_c0_g1_i1:194-640(-)